MTGESAAGVFVSFNRIITKILYPTEPEFNTILFFSISIIVISICAIIHVVILPRSDFIRYYLFICYGNQNNVDNNHQNGRLKFDDAKIINQINENVNLVNMYHRKESEAIMNLSINSDSNLINQQSQIRPSILSIDSQQQSTTGTNSKPILLSNNNRQINLQTKVQNILRTDSTEFVLPFGIDDDEINNNNHNDDNDIVDVVVVEQRKQSIESTQFDHLDQNQNANIDSNNIDDNNNEMDYCSISFKTPRTTTTTTILIRWLHYLETSIHFLQYFRRLFRRLSHWFVFFLLFLNLV